MKKYKELTAVVILVLFLAAVGSVAVMSFPTPVSAGYIPLISLPSVSIPPFTLPPDIFYLANNFREISTGTGDGNFSDTFTGGLDCSLNNLLAVGSLNSTNPEIRFFNGSDWFSRDVGFRPTGLEWQLDYRPLLYASDSYSDSVFVSANATSDAPVWDRIAGPGTELGEFDNPLGMVTNQSDTLYVVDSGNDRVQYYMDGTWYLLTDIPGAGTLVDITVVGFTIYVTDFTENCIWYKNLFSPWAKIEDSSYLNYPSYIDADSEGNLYILSWLPTGDDYERSIVKYEDGAFSIYVSPGENIGNIGTTFSFSEEICINSHDKLFYSDNTYSRIEKEKDDINELTGLTINDFKFQLMEGWTEASMTVGHGEAEVEIVTYKMCPYSTVEGDGTHPLEFGENVFPLTCVPEIGSSKEYTITITRELSDNALLSDISLDTVSIDGFNPNIFAYTGINFPNEKETVELEAISQDVNAVVAGTGTMSLNVGENLFVVSVVAQDGVANQQYIVAINRAEAPASPSPSPSSSPSPSPTPSPSPSTTPSPTPTPSPSSTPSASPTPTPAPSESTTPTSSPSSSPAPTQNPTPQPSESPYGTDLPLEAPPVNDPSMDSLGDSLAIDDEDLDDDTPGFLKKHPGIAAAAGVVVGGTFILVTQQIIKKRKKKKSKTPTE